MITYLVGDATEPKVEGRKIIAHICNDIGGWGRGFVLSLNKRWPEAEKAYRGWHASLMADPRDLVGTSPFKLGEVQFVRVAPDVHVANMIAQHDTRIKNEMPPIRYEAVEKCLSLVAALARYHKSSIHMPRIGCGLAGGKWQYIEPIVAEQLKDLDVYVYDFDTGDNRTIPWKK